MRLDARQHFLGAVRKVAWRENGANRSVQTFRKTAEDVRGLTEPEVAGKVFEVEEPRIGGFSLLKPRAGNVGGVACPRPKNYDGIRRIPGR